MSLHNKHILVGVTGSIAAYKACDLVQRLKEKGAQVRVVMTHSATRIIQPAALAALSGHPVLTDAWEGVAEGRIPHIEAARWADLFVVSPCTAHTLAELAHGLTGSPVSMTALAYNGPVAVAPAMNTVMLTSAPVREHLAALQTRGVHVLPTLNGELACGEVGEGKLTTPEEIAAYAELILASMERTEDHSDGLPDLSGKTIVISGGHTEEPLDGVRFLSNRSSGKTAIALARAFRLARANVRLVLGRAEEPDPNGIPLDRVTTSAQFRDAMHAAQPTADVMIMAAAIADFVPAVSATDEKWKASRTLKALDLTPAPNILAELGAAKTRGQILVGFALETRDALAHARTKLTERNCDLLVVNTPLSGVVGPGGTRQVTASGFGADQVEAAILKAHTPSDSALTMIGKAALAVDVVRAVAAALKANTKTETARA